ncbi:MAG: site-2 protease family protein [Haloarculaceae archaeon]
MARLLLWVLVGMAAYTLGMMFLDARGRLPDSISVSGPIVTVHTQRGRAFLNWLATPKRFWRAWGNLGVGIALVVMVGTFVAVLQSAVQAVQQPAATPVQSPQNVLVIPGLNDFLPLAAAPEIVLGLLVGLVVHEGGHGLLCRVEDIDIESMGLALISFVPMGAFVEPSEESRNRASRGSQTRMFAAGVTNNFFVAFLAFALLFGPVAGSIAVASGVPVGNTLPGSSAAAAGIGHGDRITGVAGAPVTNATDLERALDRSPDRRIPVELDGESTVTVKRRLLVTRNVPKLMGGLKLRPDDPLILRRVNGTAVYTEDALAREMREHTVARFGTNHGNVTMPIGAYVVRVNESGPMADTAAPLDRDFVITHLAGQRTPNLTALSAVLDDTSPGQTVEVVAYVGGNRETYNVTLARDPDGTGGYLNVRLQFGYSGLQATDFGVDAYPAERFLGYLGGSANDDGIDGEFIGHVIVALILPFIAAIFPDVAYNFAGFLPDITNFYTVTGPLAPLGGGVFMLANALFWTAWVNLNLGLFNCIPTFPLDGGHILRAGVESVVARLPVEGRRRLTTAVTASVSVVMLVALFAMILAPSLLN